MTGRAYILGHNDEVITLKLAADDGHVIWDELSGGPDDRNDRAWAIAVGPDDHPVVTGFSVNTDETADFWTIKYDKDSGAFIWDNFVPGAVNNLARAGWLTVLDDGDIVMANRTWTSETNYDVVMQRYAAGDGDLVWETRFGGPDSGANDPRHMIRDEAGNLVVVGVTNSDYMIVTFDGTTGDTLWTATYDGPPGWYDVATCVIIGPAGEVIVSGFSDGSGSGWDVATLGLSPTDGERLWLARHDGAGQSDEGDALAVSSLGDLYVVGYSYSLSSNMDMLSLRYILDATSDVDAAVIPLLALSAYPNPFNPRVVLSFALEEAGPARLAIFDLRGRRLVTLLDDEVAPGTHALTWAGRDTRGQPAPAGIYVARLTSRRASGEVMSVTRKIVLAK